MSIFVSCYRLVGAKKKKLFFGVPFISRFQDISK